MRAEPGPAPSPLQVGLDAAGKTTILYKLKLGEIVTTIPTIGASWLLGCLGAPGTDLEEHKRRWPRRLAAGRPQQPAATQRRRRVAAHRQAAMPAHLNLAPCLPAATALQASTWRPWSTRTSASLCGMWAARTRRVWSGGQGAEPQQRSAAVFSWQEQMLAQPLGA